MQKEINEISGDLFHPISHQRAIFCLDSYWKFFLASFGIEQGVVKALYDLEFKIHGVEITLTRNPEKETTYFLETTVEAGTTTIFVYNKVYLEHQEGYPLISYYSVVKLENTEGDGEIPPRIKKALECPI